MTGGHSILRDDENIRPGCALFFREPQATLYYKLEKLLMAKRASFCFFKSARVVATSPGSISQLRDYPDAWTVEQTDIGHVV